MTKIKINGKITFYIDLIYNLFTYPKKLLIISRFMNSEINMKK